MDAVPLTGVHGTFRIFTVATLVTEALFERIAVLQVKHSRQRSTMDITFQLIIDIPGVHPSLMWNAIMCAH